MRQGVLSFQYQEEPAARGMTALAGLPLYMEYAAPPGTPAVRLKALRIALPQTWSDAEFKAEAEKARLAPIPQGYQATEKVFNQIVSASPETLKRAKEVLGIE